MSVQQNKTNRVQALRRWGRVGLTLAAMGGCAAAWSQSVTTPPFSVPASATVATALTITSATTLNFGTFVADTAAGTVVIAPQATAFRSKTGNITLLDSGPGAPSTVAVSGAPSTTFSVNLPTSTVTLSGPNSSVMTISTFTSSLGTNNKGTIGGGGTASFLVGGTLSVGASQVPGTYSGSFSVTVTYP